MIMNCIKYVQEYNNLLIYIVSVVALSLLSYIAQHHKDEDGVISPCAGEQ